MLGLAIERATECDMLFPRGENECHSSASVEAAAYYSYTAPARTVNAREPSSICFRSFVQELQAGMFRAVYMN